MEEMYIFLPQLSCISILQLDILGLGFWLLINFIVYIYPWRLKKPLLFLVSGDWIYVFKEV